MLQALGAIFVLILFVKMIDAMQKSAVETRAQRRADWEPWVRSVNAQLASPIHRAAA